MLLRILKGWVGGAVGCGRACWGVCQGDWAVAEVSWNPLGTTRLSGILRSTDPLFPHVLRFPGFIFPCLGVHPVQEVSPEQHRGACLQVGYSVQSILKERQQILRWTWYAKSGVRTRLLGVFFLCFCSSSYCPPFLCLYAGSRCCFTLNTHAQGPTRGYRGGNTSVRHTFLSPSLHLQCCFERWRTFCLRYRSGRLRFYAQIHQKWCGQGESKAGPRSAGTASQGTGSPSVSHNNTQFGHHVILMHLVNFLFNDHKWSLFRQYSCFLFHF